MSTTLQQQLAAIAASSTNQLDLKAQRTAHGKSLIFEPRVAASQDFDSLYQICLEGFQELCGIDYGFIAFQKNIFSEQSKTEDRTQMTSEENASLDRVLESFLGAISGRLLLKPALKAVEWLVRRFRIHEYNTEYTILTFLPYHGMPLFATLLSILPRTLSPTFRFLRPYVASYTSPPRAAITTAATTTEALFTSFNNYVLRVVREHHQSTSLLSFWAAMTTQALDGMITVGRSGRIGVQQQRDDATLLLIMPKLNEGLSMKHSPEMVVACYMIIMVLVTKMSLDDKVLDPLLEAVVKTRREDTEESCLVCLAVIAQDRKAATIPNSVIKRLIKIENFDVKLASVSQQCRVDRLAQGFVLGVLKRQANLDETRVNVVQRIIALDVFSAAQVKTIMKALIRIATSQEAVPSKAAANLSALLTDLANRFDTEMQDKIFAEENTDLDSLELSLGHVLVLESVAKSNDDQMEVVNIDSGETIESQLSSALSQLRVIEKHVPVTSLDGLRERPIFNQLANAYTLALRLQKTPKAIMGLPILSAGDIAQDGTVIVFLLAMTGTEFPAAVRSSSWAQLASLLKSFDKVIDMQALLPYILSALTDKSPSVRRSSADCAIALHNSLKDAKKNPKVFQWGKTMYKSRGGDVEWLSTDDAAKIASDFLVPNLEEAILDGSRIGTMLELSLNGKKGADNDQLSGSGIKSSLRPPLANFLASHASKCPLLSVQSTIFALLGSIGKTASTARSTFILPCVREWLSQPTETALSQCHLEKLVLADTEEKYLATLHPRDSEAQQLLGSIFSGDSIRNDEGLLERASEYMKSIWPKMKTDACQTMAMFLLDLSLTDVEASTRDPASGYAMDVLRSVQLSPETLAAFLSSIPSCTNREYKSIHSPVPGTASPKDLTRKRRISSPETVKRQRLAESKPLSAEVLSTNLRRITVVLDLMDNSTKDNHIELLKGLFYVLGELQHYKTLSNSNMVYLQSLAIGSLLSVVQAAKSANVTDFDTTVIRADLLVDCVRRTSSPQVQNSALLLISSLASWLPETVLHSVMPIFTFMGSTLLRQGDDYSAHVVDQTITCVVPPLAASLRRKNRNFIIGISELLLSFTAAFEHIPSHRRITLFNQLIRTLGPNDSLAPTIMLLYDRHPVDTMVQRFVTDLLKLFDPFTSVNAMKQTLEIFEDTLQPKTKRQLADTFFSLNEKSAPEINMTQEHLLRNIETSLNNSSLRGSLSKVLKEGSDNENEVRTVVVAIVEKSIHISSLLSQREDLYDISRKVIIASLNIPPPIELVRIAERLLSRPDVEMKRTTLKAIQIRVKSVKHDDEHTIRAYLAFIPQILQTLTASNDISLKQLAVACIDQIASHLGKKDSDAILTAGEVIGTQALDHQDAVLKIMALHCLSSMVEVLGNAFIPLAPKILPSTFKRLRETLTSPMTESQLHNAAYGLICSVMEHVSFIFTGEYLRSAVEISHQSAMAMPGDEEEEARRQFYLSLCTKIDARERYQVINKTWPSAMRAGYNALHEHVEALSMALRNSSKSVVVKNSEILFQSLLQGFDLRNFQASQGDPGLFDSAQLDLIEEQLIDATLSMVLKLNDSTFRPFFVRFSEWALSTLPKKDRDGRARRAISFYSFLHVFFDRLKSIVTGYSSYVLESSAEILHLQATETNEEVLTLIGNVLKSLQKSFEFDEDDFWQSPSHFNTISAPLVHILTLPNHSLIQNLAIPAITDLARAASSTELHKELNTLLMQHLRSDSPASVRLAAVKCEQSLTDHLGEDWLNLLAEMVPFIAELQEDDDEDVEKETQRWIKMIEDILGESLDNMLQ